MTGGGSELLSIIVAMDSSGLIGRAGGLPWRIPEDLRHFRRTTLGHAVIMGRRTYERLDRPLEGRRLIVMSRDPACRVGSGVELARSPEEALECAGSGETFVAGGAAIYALFLSHSRFLYLTLVEGEFHGDTYFPAVAWEEWRLLEERRAAEAGGPACTFRRYERQEAL